MKLFNDSGLPRTCAGTAAARRLLTGAAATSLLLTTVGIGGLSTPSAFAAPPAIGINVEGVTDYSTAHLFADIAFQARRWGSTASPWDQTASIDSNGWPTTDAGVVLAAEDSPVLGVYKLSFTGQATISTVASPSVSISNVVYTSSTNRTTADVTVSSGASNIMLAFKNTKRTSGSALGSGITNLSVMRAGYAAGTTFTTPAKNLLAKFSVIRFMDFAQTNGTTEVNWSDRRLPNYASQAAAGPKGGVAWEYAIQLCNETGKDMWINIPVLASDDYITQLATLLKNGSTVGGVTYDGLDAGRKVYIEFSNEVWNTSFDQWEQNKHQAILDVVNSGFTSPLYHGEGTSYTGTDNEGDPAYSGRYNWARRRVGERLRRASDIFRSVWGGTAMMTQIRPVLMWQYNNANDTADLPLEMLNNYYNNADGVSHVATPHPVSYYVWSGGGATYYGSNNDSAATADGIFSSGIPSSGYLNRLKGDVAWSRSYGLKNAAYEGGWSVGGTGHDTATQQSAHFDSRAKTAHQAAQTQFDQAGGDLNVYYASSGRHDWTWAMTDDITDLTTPLFQAVDAINSSTRAAVTNGNAVPASGTTTLTGTAPSTQVNYGDPTTAAVFSSSGATGGHHLMRGYLLNIAGDGQYQIKVATTNGGAGGKIGVYNDGALLTTLNVPQASNQLSTIATVPWTAGLHSVLLKPVANASSGADNAGYINSVQITYTGSLAGNTHTGTWAAKMVPTATASWQNMSQVVNVVSNTAYTAGFWLKGSGKVGLRIYNGNWGTCQG